MTETFISKLQSVAETQPDAIAILDRGVPLTYGALWSQAQAIGADLARRGLLAEDIVGIDLAKSAGYIVALLGCWMAGAAFLPLDPALPPARRDFIRGEAQPKFIIDAAYTPRPAPDFAPAPLAPDQLAYLIYTSGSTGRPKGVLVTHRGLLPVLERQIAAFGLAPGKKSLFYLSISFDAALSDIGTALLSGATLVIEEDALLRDGAALLGILEARGITHFDCPPSLLRAFAPEDMPPGLEMLVIGGEPAAPETVRRWASRYTVINVYGPTEATICSSLCRCDANGWTAPLLGTPVPGTGYHIVNDELLIEGDSLARGYYRRPDLDAEKFVLHDGQRCYRTGDRVEARADGEIIFLGRIDRQFKLRGQLIEPREIEAALENLPGIRRAAALKRSAPQGDQLVAFVETNQHDAAPLKQALAATLPRYMVPDHIELLPALPLTPSGKPDMGALKTRPITAAPQTTSAPPETLTEQKLFTAWQQVLGHARFGIDDAFFAVGGDSLGVLRLTLAAERLGLGFSPGLLALYPTIRALGAALEARAPAGNAMTARQLRSRSWLPPKLSRLVQAAGTLPKAATTPNTILVTGATGCLGSRIVAELLEKGTAQIYCLIRAKDDATAAARLGEALGFESPRVTAVAGDVALENLGLSAQRWQALALEVDAVYHCAAAVNMLQDFEALAPANLGGTQNILAFALTGRIKALHYASTLSVFVATDRNAGIAREDDRLEQTGCVYGGYAQTKWAAEFMLQQLPHGLLPLHIYRFGLITGDSRTGGAAPHDFLALFIEGMAALGVIPAAAYSSELAVDITPIDYAARAMVEIGAAHPAGGTWHLANRQSLLLKDLLASLQRCGISLRQVALDEWQGMNAEGIGSAASSASLSLCRLLPPEDFERLRTMDLFQATNIRFDMSRSNFQCPAPEAALVEAYVRNVLARGKPVFRVCIIGPESTGKSTLAAQLGAYFAAPVVAEFAKDYIAKGGKALSRQDMEAIAAGQARAEDAGVMAAEGLVICDSNLLTTMLWHRYLLNDCPAWLGRAHGQRHYDLYLVTAADVPWTDDVHRIAPESVAAFANLCAAALKAEGVPAVTIAGNWDARFAAAVAAIEEHSRQRKAA